MNEINNTHKINNIPKIIHQIWLGPNKKPNIWMDSWKKNYINSYPEWKYFLWTEKEINKIKLKNRSQYEYEKYYTGKSDIARYEILNQFGGVFIDADSLWIEKNNFSLNIILEKSKGSNMFCAEEPINKWSIANGVIGFSKNHKILNEIIEYLNKNYFETKKNNPEEKRVWKVTGPKIFTEIVKKYNDSLILESFYFYPENFHVNNLELDKEEFHKKYPKSIMFQYGYSTNNVANKNIMKKYIDKN